MSEAAAAEARLLARLEALGIAVTMHRHAPVFTVEEARALRGDLPGGHAKNLFLKDKKDRLFLAVVEEGTPVDLKRLEKALGAARLSFGRAELLAEVLGVTPGAVTPFAAMNAAPGSITVVLDAALMALDPVNFHPLRNDATLAVSPQGLLAFLRGSGHAPVLFDFRQMAALPI
ncbi:MAG: prolyl-tRNA synthetase associated domain-containing protein [Alphaproteobacteria bacterium]|nr:prolyl-tRNA synthetase associated domain-containing protein [Alphaproteobacteria bacterium]